MRSTKIHRAKNVGRTPHPTTINAYLAVSLTGLIYALIFYPLVLSGCDVLDRECLYASRPENKFFWPMLSLIAAVMVASNWRRFSIAPNIAALLALLAFAGATVLWAFSPELSAIRYTQQVMIVASVVLPALIWAERGDLLRGIFYCFTLACVINIFFVLGPPPSFAENATPGYSGYFSGKNYLGICAAITLLLAIHELTYPGTRRWAGFAVAVLAITLLYLSNAKTAAGLAILAPTLALVSQFVRRRLRLSLLVVPLAILLSYVAISSVSNINVYRLSYVVYGDSTFTGRRFIWEFADSEIRKRPLHGWGYQSFWLAGPNAPSVVDAPGWIKTMPNAHNGYLDTTLEMGYIGLALLLTFVATTVHLAGRIFDHSLRRGWIVLTLAYFAICTNFFESMWMRAFELVWVLFLLLAAEVGRQWQLSVRGSAQNEIARGDLQMGWRARRMAGAPSLPGRREQPDSDEVTMRPRRRRRHRVPASSSVGE